MAPASGAQRATCRLTGRDVVRETCLSAVRLPLIGDGDGARSLASSQQQSPEIRSRELPACRRVTEGPKRSVPEALQAQFAGVRKVFGHRSDAVRRYGWGEEVLPGITAVKASGHTPGMSALEIASGDKAMVFVADITNNPLIFARHPERQAMFDMDPEDATATRKSILDRAANDKLRLHFFHAPFPATGFVAKNGVGYEFLPALWE